MINLTLMLVLGFYLDMGLLGFWYAKLVLEIFVVAAYLALILIPDW